MTTASSEEAAELISGHIDGEAALCFPDAVIAPGEVATIIGISRDYVLELGHWEMAVAADGAADLRIVGWRAGDGEWVRPASSKPVQASWFTADSFKGGGFSLCKALPGTPVALLVENVGVQQRIFRCGFKKKHLRRAR